MRYRCNRCGERQSRGPIPSTDHPFQVAVFHGIGLGLCGVTTRFIFNRLGYPIEGWLTGLASLAVCAVLLMLFYGVALIGEVLPVMRRPCSKCGRRGLQLEEAGTGNSPRPSAQIVIGGLYATRRKDASYSIVKVLAVEASIIHLRSYANRFEKLPERISSSELSLAPVSATGPFGIGHFPLARQGFDAKAYVLVGHETVSNEELDGYRIWKGIEPA
jgi:hypothetical protein